MSSSFREALKSRVLILDGAMGTQLHAANLDLEKDYLGLENCMELICATRPDVLRGIHAAYFAAGADVVETNTFGANPLVLAEFGIAERAHELNLKAALVAREAAAQFSTSEKPRWVLGSMGSLKIGAGVGSVVKGHTTIESLASNRSSWTMTAGRGLLA